jgi:hypothetical protein
MTTGHLHGSQEPRFTSHNKLCRIPRHKEASI